MTPWIDQEIIDKVAELLKEGKAVHANTMYRYVEDVPERTEALHAFMATTWKEIGEGLKVAGLTLVRGKDPTGEPCYIAAEPGQTVNVGFAVYKLW